MYFIKYLDFYELSTKVIIFLDKSQSPSKEKFGRGTPGLNSKLEPYK